MPRLKTRMSITEKPATLAQERLVSTGKNWNHPANVVATLFTPTPDTNRGCPSPITAHCTNDYTIMTFTLFLVGLRTSPGQQPR